MIRTSKGLMYHWKEGRILRDYYSVVDGDKIIYILAIDGKEIERHHNDISRDRLVAIIKGYLKSKKF